MPLLSLLRILAVSAALFALSGLAFLVIRTVALGHREHFSAPRGNGRRGVAYAFGQGMMPWEKESTARHLPTFFGGVLYHCAIFAALFYLGAFLFLPQWTLPLPPFRILFAAGSAAGLALLMKRALKPHLRHLSCADDFFANLLVDVFLLISLWHSFRPAAAAPLLLSAILLFVYLPLGKVRHCFFFFYTRVIFGIFFGRRGVFPSRAAEK